MHDTSLSSKDMLAIRMSLRSFSPFVKLASPFRRSCKLAFLRKSFTLHVHLFLDVCLGCIVMVEMSGMLSSESRDRWPEAEATSRIFKKNLFGIQACSMMMIDTYSTETY